MHQAEAMPPQRTRRRWRGAAVAVAVAVTAAAALAGCSSAAPASSSAPSTSSTGASDVITSTSALYSKIASRGYAIMGIYDSPPDSTVENGVPTGFMPEIDLAILKDMGIDNVHGSLSDFAGLAPGLQGGSVDMVSGAFFVTQARCSSMAFGEPIAVESYSFITAKGKPTFDSFAAIKAAGAKLAIEDGTYQQTIALKTLKESDMITVTSRQTGIDAVVHGQADVYVAPTEIMQSLLAQNKNDYVITNATDIQPLGTALAVTPANADFITAYNKAYDKVFSDGTAQKIYAKYGENYDQFTQLKSTVFACPAS